MKFAGVLDEFSYFGFSEAADFFQVRLEDWRFDLGRNRVALLFVESAWWGVDGKWHRKISEAAVELREMLSWCRQKQITTVFWNKEDPVHFDRFLITASLFDWVFTTDGNLIPQYKLVLGHQRVGVLPFAVQQRKFNPVAMRDRCSAACFAGSYYRRFPARCRDLRAVLDGIQDHMPVHIFDRYFNSTDKNYQFPPEYVPMIQGTLAVDELDRAYKGYRFGINMNTVKHSPTMCARRVFELLACGTVVLSNESAAIRHLLGDVVLASDDAATLASAVAPLVSDEHLWAQRAAAGVRAVLRQHTVAHRLDSITRRVLNKPFWAPLPHVLVCAVARTTADWLRLVAMFQAQAHAHRRMLVCWVGAPAAQPVAADDERVLVVDGAVLSGLSLVDAVHMAWTGQGAALPAGMWLAGWSAEDHYGPHYLEDMMLATAYTQAPVLGKAEQWVWRAAGLVLDGKGQAYKSSAALAVRASVVRLDALAQQAAQTWFLNIDAAAQPHTAGACLALDGLSYCRNGGGVPQVTAWVDANGFDLGVDMAQVMVEADNMPAEPAFQTTVPLLEAAALAQLFGPWRGVACQASVDEFGWFLVSELRDGDVETVWAAQAVLPRELRALGVWRFVVGMTGVTDVKLAVRCEGDDGEVLHEAYFEPNQRHELVLPFGTRGLRLGWRFWSSGSVRVQRLVLGWPVPAASQGGPGSPRAEGKT